MLAVMDPDTPTRLSAGMTLGQTLVLRLMLLLPADATALLLWLQRWQLDLTLEP